MHEEYTLDWSQSKEFLVLILLCNDILSNNKLYYRPCDRDVVNVTFSWVDAILITRYKSHAFEPREIMYSCIDFVVL